MNNKKKRIFDIIQIGYAGDVASRTFDIAITAAIIINLFIAIFDTFEQSIPYQPVLDVIEWITVIGFTIEYILRVWTAEYLYPNKCTGIARIKYIFSGSGIVDLLSFLPNYLPVFFPAGAVAFRMFRVIRILRIFRVNSYYDALNVITEVIRRKRDQILSSVFIIVMLIIASSLCMYSLEHEAQPEVFKNVIMLLDNHVKCGIEIDISSYEKPMRFRLVRPGSNWYTAGRTVECILEDMRSITFKIITPENKYYDEVVDKFDAMMDWLADLYVNTLNLIQYMHDKYYYEAAEMALIDTDVKRTFATGIAGFSHVVDSLSAIKYAG